MVAAVVVVVVIIVAAVAAFLLLPGAAPSTTTSTPVTSLTTPNTTTSGTSSSGPPSGNGSGAPASLVAAAQKETTLTMYGSIDTGPFTQDIWSAFQTTYPWAKQVTLNYQVLFGSSLFTKVGAEYQSKNVQADVLDGFQCFSLDTLYPGVLLNYTDIVPYEKAQGFLSGSAGYSPSGTYFPYINAGPIVIGYNNKLVTASQAPKDWSDLGNSQWGNGKFALNNPSITGLVQSLFAIMYDQFGNASATKIMQSYAANKPLIAAGIGDAYTDVQSGQAAVGIIDFSDYVSTPANNRSVTVVWPTSFAGYRPNPSCLMAQAPHPNLAKLFEWWLVSPAGVKAIDTTGRPAQFPSTFQNHLTSIGMPTSEKLIPAPENYLANPAPYSAYFKNLYGL